MKARYTNPGLEVSKGGPGEGIVYLAPFHNLEGRVPEDVKQRLNQTTQDIINGTIVVPEKYEVTTDFSQKSAVTATAKTEPKILKIALVTDGLFSDGAWGAAHSMLPNNWRRTMDIRSRA